MKRMPLWFIIVLPVMILHVEKHIVFKKCVCELCVFVPYAFIKKEDKLMRICKKCYIEWIDKTRFKFQQKIICYKRKERSFANELYRIET